MKEIILIFLFTVAPPGEEGAEAPAPLVGDLEFTWPARLGGLEECHAFRKGATIWHPTGKLYAVANCVERDAPATGEQG